MFRLVWRYLSKNWSSDFAVVLTGILFPWFCLEKMKIEEKNCVDGIIFMWLHTRHFTFPTLLMTMMVIERPWNHICVLHNEIFKINCQFTLSGDLKACFVSLIATFGTWADFFSVDFWVNPLPLTTLLRPLLPVTPL